MTKLFSTAATAAFTFPGKFLTTDKTDRHALSGRISRESIAPLSPSNRWLSEKSSTLHADLKSPLGSEEQSGGKVVKLNELCPLLKSEQIPDLDLQPSSGYGVTSDIRTGELAPALEPVSVARKPVLDKNELELEILASAITDHDLQFAERRFIGFLRTTEAGTPEKPYVPGFDCVGVVTRKGSNVKDIAEGDVMIALGLPGTGGWQQYMTTDKTLVFPKPEGWSFAEAAASATPAMVVSELVNRAGDASDLNILINGASGNIGKPVTAALARKGANITAVSSARKADEVLDLGASRVIDYRNGPLVEQLPDEKFDLIYDFSGGEEIAEQSKTLKSEDGQFISTVGPVQHNGKRRLELPEFISMMVKIGPSYFKGEFIAPMKPDAALIEEEIVKPDIRSSYQNEVSLEDAEGIKEAISRLHQNGKTIIMNYEAIDALTGETNQSNDIKNSQINQFARELIGFLGARLVGPALVVGSGTTALDGLISGQLTEAEALAIVAAGHTAGFAILAASSTLEGGVGV